MPGDPAFETMFAPHQRIITAHCYRMLGSLADTDDALQETMFRAWRGLVRFEGHSSIRTWLLRIATNVCLDELGRRTRQPVAVDPAPPDLWIDAGAADAGVALAGRESVALAFVSALQLLPPLQRAALLLRDVIGTTAAEAAEVLASSPPAVESALARARASLAERPPRLDRLTVGDAAPVLARYLAAWEARDATALVALLRDDATLTMPPQPMLVGRDAIAALLGPLFAGLDALRILPLEVAGGPGAAAYLRAAPGAPFLPHAIQAIEVGAGGIAALHTYLEPQLFYYFDLPESL